MKKEVVFIFLICILFLQFITAETTFFEGDLGHGDNFIIGNLPEENIEEEIITEILPTSGGSLQIDKEAVCNISFNSLKQHIDKYEHINYSEEEIEILILEIKEEKGITFSPEQVAVLIENFEEECGKSYPLLGGFAGGRYSEILFPFIGLIFLIILLSLIILYIFFRRLKKFKSKKNKRKRSFRKKK